MKLKELTMDELSRNLGFGLGLGALLHSLWLTSIFNWSLGDAFKIMFIWGLISLWCYCHSVPVPGEFTYFMFLSATMFFLFFWGIEKFTPRDKRTWFRNSI